MTTAIDTLFAGIVPQMLDVYGTAVTFTRRTGTVSPSTRGVSGAGTETMTTKVSPPEMVKSVAPGEGLLRVGDAKVIVRNQSISFAPTQDQFAAIGGVSHRVVMVKPLYSGDLVAAYEVFLRANA
jgi:hypothetical protein